MLRSELQKVVPAVWRNGATDAKLMTFADIRKERLRKLMPHHCHEDCQPEGFHAVFPNGIETQRRWMTEI